MPETKQQTAMQLMIEWLNEFDNAPIKPTYANMREKAWQLAAVDKQRHIDTFNAGYREGEHDGINTSSEEKDIAEFSNATVYFNSTFNTK